MNTQVLTNLINSLKNYLSRQIGSHNSSSTAHSDIRNSITNLSTVATTGSYNDLTNKPSTFTPTSHTHGSISNTGTLISGTNNVNKIVVTDNSNNIKTAYSIPHEYIDFYDIESTSFLIGTHGSGVVSAIGIIYDTTADEIYFPSSNLYDSNGNQLATLADIPSASNFITKTSSNNLLLANGNNIPQSTFLTQHQDISGKLNTADLVDELNNVVLDLIEEGE